MSTLHQLMGAGRKARPSLKHPRIIVLIPLTLKSNMVMFHQVFKPASHIEACTTWHPPCTWVRSCQRTQLKPINMICQAAGKSCLCSCLIVTIANDFEQSGLMRCWLHLHKLHSPLLFLITCIPITSFLLVSDTQVSDRNATLPVAWV